MAERFDVLVIGGGSGLTAAWHAERDGKRVALVEARPDALGGTCVNFGCVPTKGLIQAADVMTSLRDAERLGIHVPLDQVRIDYAKLAGGVLDRRGRSAAAIRKMVEGAYTPFYGRCRFVDEKVVEMEDGRRVTGDKVFVCTGARAAVPDVPGLKESGFWTNVEAIANRKLPRRLAILGAGYIAAEFGHLFASLGAAVTVVGRSEALAQEDDDVRALFRQEFGKKARLLEHHAARRVRKDGDAVVLESEGPGGVVEVVADALLVATGRTPNTDGLGLDATGVRLRAGGWIDVDRHLRTSHPDVYAYGDVIGQAMYKHTSSHEGELAYRNSQGAALEVDYAANPHAVFTDPQIGGVGLTERQARKKGLDVRVAKADYDSIAKGRVIGSPPGFAKAIVERGSDRIVGFHMAGPHAADLIHEVVVAMAAPGAKAEHVRRAIHVHPTMPELVKAVFEQTG